MTTADATIEILTGDGMVITTGADLWFEIARLPTPCRVIIRGGRPFDMSFVPWMRPGPDIAGEINWR